VDPDAEDAGTGLYALFQTDLYIPEPVVDGRIPKNAFGNLDVYVPSMVPPGAVHIRASEAKNAARLLNIDYADAVTGFQFKGRHGTAVIEGIIVALEYRAAVEAVLDSVAYAKEEAMEGSRSAESLRLWRRFLLGLRVVQRVKGYRPEGEGEEEDQIADEEFQKELEQEMAQYRDRSPEAGGGGGFFVGSEEEDMPIRATRRSRQRLSSEDQDDDAFDDDDFDNGGGFVPEDESGVDDEVEDDRGGVPSLPREPSLFGLETFDIPEPVRLPEDEHDYGGGGFMVDEDDEDVHISQGMIAESSSGRALMQTGRQASPPGIIDKVFPMDEDTVPIDEARRNLQEPATNNNDTGSKIYSLEPVPPPTPPVTSQAHARADRTTSGVLQVEAREETRPSRPTSVVSTAASSEFEDDLPLEDPDDEDAEPEWLL
jgi:xeroderma pigmentosum group C-complementing protein